jgi:hypothetical protein
MGWYYGVLGVEEPHQSIPNLVVKLYCDDNTVREALRKNSSTLGPKNSSTPPNLEISEFVHFDDHA